MKTLLIAFALAWSFVGTALADTKPLSEAAPVPPAAALNIRPSAANQMTVLEVINIGAALRQLGDHPEMGPGNVPTGRTIPVPFRFDGATLFALAQNIKIADDVQRAYQATYNAIIRQITGGKDQVPTEKMGELNKEAERALGAPANVALVRIRREGLCLDAPPKPPCSQTNNVAPALLAQILSIVDP